MTQRRGRLPSEMRCRARTTARAASITPAARQTGRFGSYRRGPGPLSALDPHEGAPIQVCHEGPNVEGQEIYHSVVNLAIELV